MNKEEGLHSNKAMNRVLNWYFRVSAWNLKRKANGKIKGVTEQERKQYVKELIATYVVAIEQYDNQTMAFDSTYFDGELTKVLNKHKNINFKYRDWTEFQNNSYNEEKAKYMLGELRKELEWMIKNKG